MTKDDLSRRFILDVCASGSVAIRERGMVIGDGRLPVFSTDTYDEANELRVLHCRLARDGSGVYFLNDKPDEWAELDPVTEMFRQSYARTRSPYGVGTRIRRIEMVGNVPRSSHGQEGDIVEMSESRIRVFWGDRRTWLARDAFGKRWELAGGGSK
jgi:hypothetical protein